jgi:hypothetical protein
LLNINSNELNHKHQQRKIKNTATIKEGDDIVAVAFFAALRCSTAPQEEEEGDDNIAK